MFFNSRKNTVRSYGTEDRETQYQIPPQEEIFNYILFRGSDIKDIRVVNNVSRVPNDPAIMRMELSNKMSQQNFQPQFPMPGMGHEHVAPFANQGGVGPYNSLGGLGNMGGLPRGQLPPGVPSSSGGPFVQQQQQQQQSQQQLQQQQPQQPSKWRRNHIYVNACIFVAPIVKVFFFFFIFR